MGNGNNSKRTLKFLGGICIGLCIGVLLGIIMEDMYLWSVIGLGIGVCFGTAFSKKGKTEDEETNGENQDGNNNT